MATVTVVSGGRTSRLPAPATPMPTEHNICLQHMGEEEAMMHRQELVICQDRRRRRGIIIISSNRPSRRSRRWDPSPESPPSWKRPCGGCWVAAARVRDAPAGAGAGRPRRGDGPPRQR
uniref:Uncharacterized protein n=1 Tax=Oryza meridionalis TaxID=40149 RepID=A0A0E0EGW6_9ORYZ